MSFLGSDWQPGPDGLRQRIASRVLVFDAGGRLLLARGHDLDNPGRRWWFTIGGGRLEEESPRAAAVRELFEETGIRASASSLEGPVLTRSAIFDFAAETVRQHEEFFVLRLSDPPLLDTSRWSRIERAMMETLRWWDLRELADHSEQVYPEGLAELASTLARRWDGRVVHLGEVQDPG